MLQCGSAQVLPMPIETPYIGRPETVSWVCKLAK